MKWITPVVLLFALTPKCLAAEKDEKQKPPQSIDELRQQLEEVLAETHTPDPGPFGSRRASGSTRVGRRAG